ncbi:hypothetical protein GY45DRAFT_705635 [Cubamyces sp. BRFM 1775]|nr:hypothetical protein GY45DRAFT_705635 [Cubamyces sp. BRFM 1775]
MSGRCVRGARGEAEVYREVVGGRESEKRKPAVWLPWTWPAERGARRAARDRAGWQRNCRPRAPPPFEFVPGLRRFLPRGYLPTAATIISGRVGRVRGYLPVLAWALSPKYKIASGEILMNISDPRHPCISSSNVLIFSFCLGPQDSSIHPLLVQRTSQSTRIVSQPLAQCLVMITSAPSGTNAYR